MTRPPDAASGTEWWRTAVIYQVYPRSFADGDGDGVGDLAGLLRRLPYIASLGVDGIWLTPFQPSPQVDQGYDVSDYCGVDPLFGTLAQFDDLLATAHTLGLRVILDVVPNHCSSEHPFFRTAVAAAPGSPERAMFHIEDGPGGALEGDPPNNWRSVFGGSAWSRIAPDSETDRQWYLHLFSPGQPDWNWRNPAVGEYFEGVLRFWFDRGVDGLRIDVAHALFKAEGLPDADRPEDVVDGLRSNPQVSDQEEVHAVYRRWRRLADSYSPARVLVGEVNLAPHRAARYTRPDEMHQAFAFTFATVGWDPAAWARIGTELDTARREHGAPPTWALENHDLVRTVTRFDDGGGRGVVRARAGLLALLGLPGGAYIYQGQEVDLPEVDVPAEARADPMWTRSGVSRDGARVPLPWTIAPAGSFGFSPTDDAVPWLPIPPGWGSMSVEARERDAASTLHLVRAALDLRRSLHEEGVLSPHDGGMWRAEDNGLLVCERSELFLVAVAMGDAPVRLPEGRIILASSALTTEGLLPPDAAAWVCRA
ncbi:alpha-amylase family glycosyl hydrolase [uncultured Arthrobacter sp.]|uniref:alpha-amylase family glycosyl hydrolase n=1 Tax=uncultured Arthrobacter sp. TaxID=114050 RepID=UPI0026209FC6|nr:alpha-amylase family glycosyl hydrolase [uncultured Arthrobacter sp.]